MAPRLSRVQLDTAKVLLLRKVAHTDISEAVKCSIPTVKWMSRNLNKYGDVHGPKLMLQGRSPLLTREMIDVHPSFIPRTPSLCLAMSVDRSPSVHSSKAHHTRIAKKWWSSLKRSMGCLFLSPQSAVHYKTSVYLAKKCVFLHPVFVDDVTKNSSLESPASAQNYSGASGWSV